MTVFGRRQLMTPRKQPRRQTKWECNKETFELRKVSFLFNINSLHPSTYFIFTAAAALPAPIELFSPAVFNIGDLVQSTPDTTPGVDRSHSVAIWRRLVLQCKLKVEGGWFYNLRSIHHFHPLYLTLPFARPRCLNTVWPGKELRKWEIDWTYCFSSLFRIFSSVVLISSCVS
jgi:hypothetical protein